MSDLFGSKPLSCKNVENSEDRFGLNSFGFYMSNDFSLADTSELLKEPELKEVLICPHVLKANNSAIKGLLNMSEGEFEKMQELFSSDKMLELIMTELRDKTEIELFRVIHRLFKC